MTSEELFEAYLKQRTAANVLSMDSFALAFCAHNEALQAAREIMLADRAGELGKSMDEFNEARGKAVELRRAGRLKAPSDRKLLESLRKEEQNKTADTPQLSTISARDLQDKEIPPAKFIVAELLPQGLALLASPPKYGKSWFVLDLCLSVAAGEQFLNHQTVKRGCLYLALEDSERRLQDRMNKILQGERAPMGFDYATSVADIEHGLIQQLEEYITQHPDTGLIVVDTLQKVRASANGKESAYSADYKETALIKNFADSHGVCVLLVHHLRKANDDTDPFNRISGTNGIFGAVDTAMVMTRTRRGDGQTTLSVTGRDIDSGEFSILFDKTAWKWKSLGNLEEVTAEQRKEEYRQSPVVITIRELLRQSSTGTWTGSMKQLLEAGQIITGTWIEPTTEKLASTIKKMERDLFTYDRIMHRRADNGTGGKKHWFGLSTVGSLPDTVGAEQQTLD